jgi:hypothetical protein
LRPRVFASRDTRFTINSLWREPVHEAYKLPHCRGFCKINEDDEKRHATTTKGKDDARIQYQSSENNGARKNTLAKKRACVHARLHV